MQYTIDSHSSHNKYRKFRSPEKKKSETNNTTMHVTLQYGTFVGGEEEGRRREQNACNTTKVRI